jgi:hypothetical protein
MDPIQKKKKKEKRRKRNKKKLRIQRGDWDSLKV